MDASTTVQHPSGFPHGPARTLRRGDCRERVTARERRCCAGHRAVISTATGRVGHAGRLGLIGLRPSTYGQALRPGQGHRTLGPHCGGVSGSPALHRGGRFDAAAEGCPPRPDEAGTLRRTVNVATPARAVSKERSCVPTRGDVRRVRRARIAGLPHPRTASALVARRRQRQSGFGPRFLPWAGGRCSDLPPQGEINGLSSLYGSLHRVRRCYRFRRADSSSLRPPPA